MARKDPTDLVLGQVFRDELVDQINRSVVLAGLLQSKQGINDQVRWVAKGDGKTARTHAPGASVSTFDHNEEKSASLSYGLYESTWNLADESVAFGAVTNNPTEQARLVLRETMDTVTQLAKKIEQDLFSGSGANSIVGLDSAISDTGTYAGIDRSVDTYWQSTVSDPGSLTALTKKQIRDDIAKIEVASGERPDLMVMHPQVFDNLAELFETQREFVSQADANTQRPTLGNPMRPRVFVDGVEAVPTVDGYFNDGATSADSGSIYYLNRNWVHTEFVPYQQITPLDSSSQAPQLPFGLSLKQLPSDGHNTKFLARAAVQLVLRKPNAHGKRVNIKIT